MDRAWLVATLLAGCRLHFDVTENNAMPIDGAIDGSAAGELWIVTSEQVAGNPVYATRRWTGGKLHDDCATTPATSDAKHMVAHPTLPVVYAVESDLQAIRPGCQSSTIKTAGLGLGPRDTAERAAVSPVGGAVFFAMDGPGMNNTFRSALDGDGLIAVGTKENGPTNAAVAAIDDATRVLFVAGQNALSAYQLNATFDFTGETQQIATPCASPVDIVIRSRAVALFCADAMGAYVFRRAAPAMLDPPVTRLAGSGPFVTVHGPGEAIWATSNGTPSTVSRGAWQGNGLGLPALNLAEAPIGSAIVASALSPDGSLLAVVSQGATIGTSIVTLLDAATLAVTDTSAIPATVSAIAIANPP